MHAEFEGLADMRKGGLPMLWVEGCQFDEERCAGGFACLDELFRMFYAGSCLLETAQNIRLTCELVGIHAIRVNVQTFATRTEADNDRPKTELTPHPFAARCQQSQEGARYVAVTQHE